VAANGWDIVLKKMTDLPKFNRAVKIGVTTILATQKKRIFVDGKDATGGKIGTYSTEPISISKKNQAKNTSKTYFKGGYSEYKSDIGKNPGFVNLVNTGQEFQDYAVFDLGNDSVGIGFHNELNFLKSQGQEKHFGKTIFQQSSEEGIILNQVIDKEIGKDLP